MRKEGYVQSAVLIILAVAVLVMSVGYAAYTRTLSIEGTATFNKASYDVHFDTTTFLETSTIQATTKSTQDTQITYTVTLPKPGDVYTFEVNAKNFGTIDAKLTKITLTGLTAAQQKFIEYKVNYNGTDYTTTTDNLAIALAAEASHKVTVSVKYLLPEDPADLPSTDATVSLTVDLDYDKDVE